MYYYIFFFKFKTFIKNVIDILVIDFLKDVSITKSVIIRIPAKKVV